MTYLFRPSKIPFASQYAIMFFQKLLFLEHGHFDSIHAALCVDVDNGDPFIAHTYESINNTVRVRGYIRQSLKEMLDYENKLIKGNHD